MRAEVSQKPPESLRCCGCCCLSHVAKTPRHCLLTPRYCSRRHPSSDFGLTHTSAASLFNFSRGAAAAATQAVLFSRKVLATVHHSRLFLSRAREVHHSVGQDPDSDLTTQHLLSLSVMHGTLVLVNTHFVVAWFRAWTKDRSVEAVVRSSNENILFDSFYVLLFGVMLPNWVDDAYWNTSLTELVVGPVIVVLPYYYFACQMLRVAISNSIFEVGFRRRERVACV